MVKEFKVSFKGQELTLIQKDNGKFIKPKIFKELEGSYAGSQLKPAVEVILVCMKPLSEKTYVEQALKNRKGVTWLNNCRIPAGTEHFRGNVGAKITESVWKNQSGFGKPFKATDSPLGRFPANLICSSKIDVNIDALLEAKRLLK